MTDKIKPYVIGGIAKGEVFQDLTPAARALCESADKTLAMPTLLLEGRGEEKVLHVLTHGANLLTIRSMLKTALDMVDAKLGVA